MVVVVCKWCAGGVQVVVLAGPSSPPLLTSNALYSSNPNRSRFGNRLVVVVVVVLVQQ